MSVRVVFKKSAACWMMMFLAMSILMTGVANWAMAAEISRDEYGVWTVSAPEDASLEELFEASGYAVATDRLWQLELFRRQASGTLAELFGPDFAEQDIFIRTIGYSDTELSEAFEALNDETREMIRGYVMGINRRIDEVSVNPAVLPFEFLILTQQFGVPVMPGYWREVDALAVFVMAMRNFDPEALSSDQLDNLKLLFHLQSVDSEMSFIMFNDLRWLNDPDAQTYLGPLKKKPGKSRGSVIDSCDVSTQQAQAAQAVGQRYRKMVANLEKLNARVKMGSYAWAVCGDHTQSGNPTLYAGPQMGFSAPTTMVECTLRGAGINLSGMTLPGVPGILLGRTPHHAWSVQVGQAHTTDYYFESSDAVEFNRMETVNVAGVGAIQIPVYRTDRGPVINPLPLDLSTYDSSSGNPIISWRYAHWGFELKSAESLLKVAYAQSMDQFGEAAQLMASSQHFCYIDRDGNIAYWMAGLNPEREPGEWRLPQGSVDLPKEWVPGAYLPVPSDCNTSRGYYAGWNNKTHSDYDTGHNYLKNIFGPFNRSHVIYSALESGIGKGKGEFSFEQLRDLAVEIATTDSLGLGGNPWVYVKPYFTRAVIRSLWEKGDLPQKLKRLKALAVLRRWDGKLVPGGPGEWPTSMDRADGWMLMDAWIHEVLRLTFGDELGPYMADQVDAPYDSAQTPMAAKQWRVQERQVLINVLLHGLNKRGAIQNGYDWFSNSNPDAPQRAGAIIVAALDSALEVLGKRPWGEGQRGTLDYDHALLGILWQTPFASRSTYGQVVEMGPDGPVRIETMFPLGPSGQISLVDGKPVPDPSFFSMTGVYDSYSHRPFPLFD